MSIELVPSEFIEEELVGLEEIRRDWRFIEGLQRIRHTYADSMNNPRVLTLAPADREEIVKLEKPGCGWALGSPHIAKLPSERDIRKLMKQLSKQAVELHETLENLGSIATNVLLIKGISPTINQRGSHWPGLDSGLIVRLKQCLGYLSECADTAVRASDYEGMVFPKDWKKRFTLNAIRGIAREFDEFDITVTDYRPNIAYNEGKASEGGDFYRAVKIVLLGEPSRREWNEFFKERRQRA